MTTSYLLTLNNEDVQPPGPENQPQPQQEVTPAQETLPVPRAPFVIVRALPPNLSAAEREPFQLVTHVLAPSVAAAPTVTWFFNREPLSSDGNWPNYRVPNANQYYSTRK